jgi:WD40 repeat protein
MYGDKNSKAASDFASKRKAQMERAQALKDAREREKRRQELSSLELATEEVDRMSLIPQNRQTATARTSINTVKIETYNDNTGRAVAERIVISHEGGSVKAPTRAKMTPALLAPSKQPSTRDIGCSPYHNDPSNPSGRCIDISDRPIMCSTTFGDEVFFGVSDHLIHCVNVADTRARPTKLTGHTDWLTSLAVTRDGCVVSGGMDGNLFLWSRDKKRKYSLVGGHSKSISKIVADPNQNVFVSAGYDAHIAVWSPSVTSDGENSISKVKPGSRAASSRTAQTSIEPIRVLRGRSADPITDCVLFENIASAGNRDGKVMVWDLESGSIVTSLSAHLGPITTLMNPDHPHLLVSAGVDGYIKYWDLRSDRNETGMLFKNLAHFGKNPRSSNDASVAGMATTKMAMVDYAGSGSASYLLSGGADSALTLQDMRMDGNIIFRHDNHCRNGIQAMAVADASTCAFVGDGAGMAMCYNLVSGQLMYGLGASSHGGVCVMHAFDNMLISGGEDGKAMIYNYR